MKKKATAIAMNHTVRDRLFCITRSIARTAPTGYRDVDYLDLLGNLDTPVLPCYRLRRFAEVP